MSRQPLMAGNWKLYKTAGEAETFIRDLVAKLSHQSGLPDIVLCMPFTALDRASQTLCALGNTQIAMGAQNMANQEEGAYTGEIAPRMLAEFGTRYVILGHSERREYYGETDLAIQQKALLALHHGLTPIICVGESLTQREAGETDAWVTQQVKAALTGISPEALPKLVFAYEPIWAIGTGKVCEADEANRVIGLIRQAIGSTETRILYGGSMKPDNVVGLMAQPEIDGGLVGGASLQVESFVQLIQACLPVGV